MRRLAAVVALALLVAAPAPADAQAPAKRHGPRRAGLLRADAPFGTLPPTLPDPSLANGFNSVRDGINLNGVGVLQTLDPSDPDRAFFCTTQRIGPRTLVAAAHCVTDDLTGALLPTARSSTTYFIGPSGNFEAFTATNVRVRPDWGGFNDPATALTGDVAVINFAHALPGWVTTYDILDEVIPPGVGFSDGELPVTLVGYGTYGTGAGPTAFGDFGRRWGQNYVDYTGFFGYDNGMFYTTFEDAEGNYASTCAVLGVCNPSRGATEAGTGGGDSGGPLFVGGRLAGVLSLGTAWCDPDVTTACVPYLVADPARDDGFGTLSGYAPLAPNLAFIRAATIPEPSTVLLLGAGIAVLGAAGARARGRRLS